MRFLLFAVLVAPASAADLASGARGDLPTNPLDSGEPAIVEVSERPADAVCQDDVPPSRAILSVEGDELCYASDAHWYLPSSDPKPSARLPKFWFASEHGKTASFQPVQTIEKVSSCVTPREHLAVWRAQWKHCTPNEGVLQPGDSRVDIKRHVRFYGVIKVAINAYPWRFAE